METQPKYALGDLIAAGGFEGAVEHLEWSPQYGCWSYRVHTEKGYMMLFEPHARKVTPTAVAVAIAVAKECEHSHPPAAPATLCAKEESAAEPGLSVAKEEQAFAYEESKPVPVKPLKWHKKHESVYYAEGANGYYYLAGAIPNSTKWSLMYIHGDPFKNTGIGIGRYATLKLAKAEAQKHFFKESQPGAPRAGLKQEEADLASSCVPIVTLKRDGEKYERCLKAAQSLGPMTTARAIYGLLHKPMMEEDQEVFLVVGTDVRGQLRGVVEVARGQRSQVAVGITDMIRAVSAMGCERFVVVHQHPSGVATPSKADKDLTEDIKRAFKPLEQEVVFGDHVIIGANGQFYSFLDKKLYKA